MIKNQLKRIVYAPQPVLTQSTSLPANRVISVQLNVDEAVEWIWTLSPDRTRYVSGYNIIKKTE